MEAKIEEPYFNKNLKLNQRYQINSEKDDDDHNDDNINFQTEKIIIRKIIVECCDQLIMRKDNYAYFVIQNGTSHDNGSKTLEKRELTKILKFSKRNSKRDKKRKLLPFCPSN